MRLSPHFHLDEMTASETAARHGIANEPNETEIRNLACLCEEVLEPLRASIGRPIIVTSGFRCVELNRRLGSKDTSDHVAGRAADIKVHGLRPIEVCQRIADLELPYRQLIHEFGAWTHVSIPADNEVPRRQHLTIDRLGTRPGLEAAR
ncbi:D-Ala-D-Ala carboxypeptidase family metallohydrolase [Panacagrimonas sp.]|uniref:D-Ala-D-Ala carboxypeptidase family metallohydrolase n=1 Tax=Panacagrimonas sp. TaxID=2480088 RepID=UPI003B5283F3